MDLGFESQRTLVRIPVSIEIEVDFELFPTDIADGEYVVETFAIQDNTVGIDDAHFAGGAPMPVQTQRKRLVTIDDQFEWAVDRNRDVLIAGMCACKLLDRRRDRDHRANVDDYDNNDRPHVYFFGNASGLPRRVGVEACGCE